MQRNIHETSITQVRLKMTLHAIASTIDGWRYPIKAWVGHKKNDRTERTWCPLLIGCEPSGRVFRRRSSSRTRAPSWLLPGTEPGDSTAFSPEMERSKRFGVYLIDPFDHLDRMYDLRGIWQRTCVYNHSMKAVVEKQSKNLIWKHLKNVAIKIMKHVAKRDTIISFQARLLLFQF